MRFRFQYDCIECCSVGAELVDYDDVNARKTVGLIRVKFSKDWVNIMMGKTKRRQVECVRCGGTKFHETESVEEGEVA